MPCDDCSRAETCPPCVNETEPKGSERSSPDERCEHIREGGCCSGPGYCAHMCAAPAAGETAGCVVPHHVHTGGPGDVRLDTCRDDPEPETAGEPECRCTPQDDGLDNECVQHPLHVGPEAPELCHCGIGTPEECATGPAGCGPNSDDPRPPRRPPYAVAYELEDGTAYEVALPGDATVGSFNGALVITHTSSPVKGLTQARPMEQ